MKRALAIVVVGLSIWAGAGCGGGKQSSTTPLPGPEPDQGGAPVDSNDPSMVVQPETLDQIQRAFARKAAPVSRCLAMVVENQELPRNSHGKITVQVEITTAGTAGQARILKSTLPSNKTLEDCVLEHMRELQFPEVPKAFPSTYSYAIEAM